MAGEIGGGLLLGKKGFKAAIDFGVGAGLQVTWKNGERMSSEIKLNLVACLCILVAIIFVIMFVLFDKKIGGNVLNTKSYKTETSFFIADKNENQREVSEEIWNKSYKIIIVTFIFLSLAMICLLYLFSRYIFIPTMKRNLQILISFFRKM